MAHPLLKTSNQLLFHVCWVGILWLDGWKEDPSILFNIFQAIWQYEQKFGKRKMADSDFNFFFKNPKYPLGNPPFCLWNHQKWFWGPKIAPLSFSQKF